MRTESAAVSSDPVGAAGDATIFRITEGRFVYQDTDGNSFTGEKRWLPHLTVCGGRVWWQVGGEGA